MQFKLINSELNFGGMALFRESSYLSWAPWNSRESEDSSSIRERSHSLGLGELNYSPIWTEQQRWQKQMPRYTRQGGAGEVAGCREASIKQLGVNWICLKRAPCFSVAIEVRGVEQLMRWCKTADASQLMRPCYWPIALAASWLPGLPELTLTLNFCQVH